MQLKNGEVRVENTTICNAKCTICPRDKFTRKKETMPMGLFEDVVMQAYELGATSISIFGYGEPLCDPKLEKKVELCTALGLGTFVTTNASLLDTERSFALVKAGLGHIRFSVHGTWDTHEKVHRGLRFGEVFRNIGNFIKISRGEVTTSVSAIPMHGESVERIKQLWLPGRWVDFLEVWRPHNWTTGREYRGLSKRRKKTCGRPFSGPIQINADGTMMVCCFDYNGEMIVGDTKEEPIDDILRGDKFNAIRERHRNGDLKGLPCETCDQLNIGNRPLLFSNRDPELKINVTSSTKYQLKES